MIGIYFDQWLIFSTVKPACGVSLLPLIGNVKEIHAWEPDLDFS